MTPWYIASRRFGPHLGRRWTDYVAWSGLTQLEEVVSLDYMLCRGSLDEIRDDYWDHIVNEDFLTRFFVDLPFLLAEVAAIPDRQILRVVREPESGPEFDPAWPGFEALGYDLLDAETSISALTNCGGFPAAFDDRELSPRGLLASRDRAFAVRDDLLRFYPEEHHADCRVWEIARLVED